MLVHDAPQFFAYCVWAFCALLIVWAEFMGWLMTVQYPCPGCGSSLDCFDVVAYDGLCLGCQSRLTDPSIYSRLEPTQF